MDIGTWGWTLLPYFNRRVDFTCDCTLQDSRGGSTRTLDHPLLWHSFLQAPRLCLVSLWRCHVDQGGSARPLGSLLGRVRSSVLGLEGETQAGFMWVLRGKKRNHVCTGMEVRREVGTSETGKGFGNESYYVAV